MKQLKRVQFFYEDGTSKFIEGEELALWNSYNEQVALSANVRGVNPKWENVNWTEDENLEEYNNKV